MREDYEIALASNRSPQALGLALIALSVAVIVFAVTSPFAVIDWPNYRISVIDEQGAMVRGDADFPYTRQYRGTLPFIYNIEQQIRWGMGWPLGLLAFIGLAWALARALAGRASPAEWVLLAWCVPYFALTGLFMVKFMRYMLPLLPFFSLMGAALWEGIGSRQSWIEAYRRARDSISTANHEDAALDVSAWVGRSEGDSVDVQEVVEPRPWWAWLAPTIGLFVLIGSAVWALAFVNGVYGHSHSWIAACVGSTSMCRRTASFWPNIGTIRLPGDLQKPAGYYRGAYGYRVTDLPNYEEDTQAKFQTIKRMVNEADYIVLATNRLYRSIPRLPAISHDHALL
ncbi:hypothetical protein [Candidatus Amarolinea dominans]|uniref:hypothetical protein n=1 Tax=Candidatus Amarolinea dominans TaxID=3140696 RepID=UPI0031374E2B|nr:hypothetical protein [Anaerolineae bacterium]